MKISMISVILVVQLEYLCNKAAWCIVLEIKGLSPIADLIPGGGGGLVSVPTVKCIAIDIPQN